MRISVEKKEPVVQLYDVDVVGCTFLHLSWHQIVTLVAYIYRLILSLAY